MSTSLTEMPQAIMVPSTAAGTASSPYFLHEGKDSVENIGTDYYFYAGELPLSRHLFIFLADSEILMFKILVEALQLDSSPYYIKQPDLVSFH
jgi:hypothetical protein